MHAHFSHAWLAEEIQTCIACLDVEFVVPSAGLSVSALVLASCRTLLHWVEGMAAIYAAASFGRFIFFRVRRMLWVASAIALGALESARSVLDRMFFCQQEAGRNVDASLRF